MLWKIWVDGLRSFGFIYIKYCILIGNKMLCMILDLLNVLFCIVDFEDIFKKKEDFFDNYGLFMGI